MDHRYGKVEWGPHGERKRTSEENWKKPIKWNADARAFKREHGYRPRVFCASLADVFIMRSRRILACRAIWAYSRMPAPRLAIADEATTEHR